MQVHSLNQHFLDTLVFLEEVNLPTHGSLDEICLYLDRH